MADISRELAAIMEAVYGREVRGSIHDAIAKINDVADIDAERLTQIIEGLGNIDPDDVPDLVAAVLEVLADIDYGEDIETLQEQVEELINKPEPEQLGDFCKLKEPVIISHLEQLDSSAIYSLFDVYVTKGILTKTQVGYATAAIPATGTAANDTTRPIYMYSYRKPTAEQDSRTGNITLLLSACVHGNEKTGIAPMLNLLDQIDKGDNPFVDRIISRFNVDFLPVMNPYGVDAFAAATTDPDFYEGSALTVALLKSTMTYIESAKGDENYQGSQSVTIKAACQSASSSFVDEAQIAAYYGSGTDLTYSVNGLSNRVSWYNGLLDGSISWQGQGEKPSDTVLENRRDAIRAIRSPYLNELNALNRDVVRVGRTNARKVNINRNADYCWESYDANTGTHNYKGDSPASEKETQLLSTLSTDMKYAFYVEFHGLMETPMAQILTDGPTVKNIGRFCLDQMARRVADFGIDYDAYNLLPGGGYKALDGTFERVPFPANKFVHDRVSTEKGCILEFQRFDETTFFPADSQAYTSEASITFLAKICDFLVYDMTSGRAGSYRAGSGVRNLLPMDGRDWGHIQRGGTGDGQNGIYNRISTNDGIPVKANESYLYGVSSADNNIWINMRFVPTSGTAENLGFSQGTQRFSTTKAGVVYVFLRKGTTGTYIDPLDIGKTIVPFLQNETDITTITK